jgi:hypothetical protein
LACDVSNLIIERNKKTYLSKNLEFKQLNITEDELPFGEIAFVRQVLQHLNNDDIHRFVKKVNKSGHYKALIVTEHVATGAEFRANTDKPRGSGIRVSIGSGVDIAEEPFNLNYQKKRFCWK